MKTTISLNDFTNNAQLQAKFSYDGLVALFDYVEDYEQSCGVELDLDPIALRCEFTEYNNIKDAYENYQIKNGLTELDMLDYLQENTQVIEFETGIILQNL